MFSSMIGANCFPITALLNPYTFHCGFFSHTLGQKSAVHSLMILKKQRILVRPNTGILANTEYFYSKESFVLKKN